MDIVFIILFFFDILIGSLLGVYCGLSILLSNYKHKKKKVKTKKNKNRIQKNKVHKPKENIKKETPQKTNTKTPLSKVKEKNETTTFTDEEFGLDTYSKKNAIRNKMEKQDDAYNSVRYHKKKQVG